ncbi:MAG: four helix bundle protein [Sulfuricaulis sp.]|uniref:four helix bundle protein n=1 Tax=Sulfuricaulis sp. TaxID=2003553 RepID=UPI0034A31E92
MKAVILAGGAGTRLSEETVARPKPMVEIGGKPILWHIMKIYSAHGINEFIICLGYKGYVIKEYFANYFLHMSDVTFDMAKNKMEVHHNNAEPWKVTLVDTGEATMTGGRLRRVREYVEGEERFCFTYGDGVGGVDIQATIAFHRKLKLPAAHCSLNTEHCHMKFEDLDVWKRSARLSADIYRGLADSKDYGFRDQLTRASLSIPANIAEGFERDSRKEMARFLSIAKGSRGELRSHIYIGMEIAYIPKASGLAWIAETKELSAMLVGLIRSLKID